MKRGGAVPCGTAPFHWRCVMALISDRTVREAVPHEEDAWIEVRALRRKQLKAARKARQTEVFENLRAMGGELVRELQSLNTDTEKRAEVDAAAKDPLTDYSVDDLIAAGIVAWSYGDAVDADALDEQTAEWAARTILRLSGVRTEAETFRPA